MTDSVWVGEIDGVRFRFDFSGNDDGRLMISRWSPEREEYTDSCMCSPSEIDAAIERVGKRPPKRVREKPTREDGDRAPQRHEFPTTRQSGG